MKAGRTTAKQAAAAGPAKTATRAPAPQFVPDPTGLLELQRAVGNRAVQRLLSTPGVVQRRAIPSAAASATPQATAARGTAGPGGPLPHLQEIKTSFGRHDVSRVKAFTGGAAAFAAGELGARAFAYGDRVAFASRPDLRTAAHEAAHVVQQRSGLRLAGGVGEEGDEYERNADAVADRVVRGESAEDLLEPYAGNSPSSVLQHKALQFDKKNPTAREYYYGNVSDIRTTARKVVEAATYSTYSDSIHWYQQDSMAAFAQTAAWKIESNSRYDIESLIQPEQLPTLVDRARLLNTDAQSGFPETKGPRNYFTAVGIEVGNALVRRISESLQRMLPRFVDARQNQKTGGPVDVVTSHPMDALVVDALSSLKAPVSIVGGYKPAVQRPRTTRRPVKLTPEGKSGMWYRLVSPADATVEEIAQALFNDTDDAYRIEDARPLFGVRTDARYGKNQDIDATTALVDTGGALLEEAALAEAGTATKARPRDKILDQMRLSAQVLRTSLREAAGKFGLAGRTEAPAKRIDARVAQLAKAGDAEVAKWDRQAASQAHFLEQAGNGLVADIGRLSMYAPQFGLDLAADPAAFKLPAEYRAALREDAELWTKVAEFSDLANGAEQHVHAASLHTMTLDVEILERSLDATRDATYAAKDAPDTKAITDPDALSKREEKSRLELAKLRAQMLADPTKIDQKAANKTNDEARDLIFESQLVSNRVALEEAWKALDDVDSWATVVSRDEPMIAYLKKQGKRFTAQWNSLYADFKAGKKTEARKAFEAMVAEEDFRQYLGTVHHTVTKAAKHARIVKLITVVVIMVVSMGVGSVISGAVVGGLGAGTEAAVFGAETMAVIGGVTRFVAFTAAMTFLENRAFSKDHSLKEYLGELGKNILLFGALESLGVLIRASGVTKIFEVGKKIDTPAKLLQKSTNEIAEMILVGGVGVAFAYVQAKVEAAVANKQLTEEQVQQIVEDNVAQTIMFTVLGRLMASPLQSIHLEAQHQSAKWKAALDGWYAQRDWLNNVGKTPKLDVVGAAAGRDRVQAQREIDALEELRDTAKKDSDVLSGTGLKATDFDPKIASVRTGQQRSYALEMSVSFKQLGPNEFLVPRSKIKSVLATIENGAKATVESTDASGAKTYKVPPKNATDLPLRLVEDIPLWERSTSGKEVIETAKKAGVGDALQDVAASQGEHLVQANDAAKNGEDTVRYHLEQAGLDPKTRDAMLRIWNVDSVRKAAAADPVIAEGLDKLEKPFDKQNVAEIVAKILPGQVDHYFNVIQESGLTPGEMKSAGVEFFTKLGESEKALRFGRRYGLKLTLVLSRRFNWTPDLDATFDAIDSRASADPDGTRGWRDQIEKARSRAKIESLLGKAKPPRAKPVRSGKKDLPVDRTSDNWETMRLQLERDLPKRGQNLDAKQLDQRADCEIFFELAKDQQFRRYARTKKIELLDTFDKVARQSDMPTNWINAHRGVISEAFFNPQFGRPKARFHNKGVEHASIPDYEQPGAGFTEYVNQKSNVIDSGTKNSEGVFVAGVKVARDHLKIAKEVEKKNLPDGARYSLDYVREPNPATIEAMKDILFKDGVTIYRVKFGDTWHTNPKYKAQ